MAPKKQPYPVLIIWNDAHGMFSSWEDLNHPEEHDRGGYEVSTVGYLLHDVKEGHHVVALNLSDYHVADGIAIPDGMVVSVTKLVPAQKRKK